jgi:hypothetical protein
MGVGALPGAAPWDSLEGAGFDFSSNFVPIPFFLRFSASPTRIHPSNSAH